MKHIPDEVQIAEVAVAAPLTKALSYRVPERLSGRINVGSRIKVPLGRRQAVGYVLNWVEFGTEGLKEIIDLLDEEPLFHCQHALFYRRAADYYVYPLGEVVRTALPAGLSGRGQQPAILQDKLYRPTAHGGTPKGSRQQEVLNHIRASGELPLSRLREQFPAPHAVLSRLVELGFVSETVVERRRDPFLGVQVTEHVEVKLTPDQENILKRLSRSVTELPKFSPFLLHGVTGSGKTEVYLRTMVEVLRLGRQALVLVPEIALTPQLVGRFRSRFQKESVRLSVLHSGLSDGERYDAWRAVANGEVDVVVGARSAVFAPLPNLGLIVVDEEHDGSYKQSEAFRYNARDLALMRGQMEKALVILGSATPSLTTYHRARQGKIGYLQLPERTAGRSLPKVELVNLTKVDMAGSLSPSLCDALAKTLSAGEQSLLLLNRRGYAPFLLCHDCGATLRCPNCAITLTFSMVQKTLRCHYCDYRQQPPQSCDRCRGQNMMAEGFGTERLEEELRGLFPKAKIARMDRDTTTRKGAHDLLVQQMNAGAIDVLIGTQMIAKGHDFPDVTLVGVLNADTALNLPDFRSAERVFALLSQVAGRAGRGDRPGRVLIQTYAPDHDTLNFVVHHDYTGFAELELSQRQALSYPPFGHLINLVFSGNDKHKVCGAAEQLFGVLGKLPDGVELLGPAPCLLARLRGKHRMQVLLKAEKRLPLRSWLFRLNHKFKVPAGVNITIDVDPIDMF